MIVLENVSSEIDAKINNLSNKSFNNSDYFRLTIKSKETQKSDSLFHAIDNIIKEFKNTENEYIVDDLDSCVYELELKHDPPKEYFGVNSKFAFTKEFMLNNLETIKDIEYDLNILGYELIITPIKNYSKLLYKDDNQIAFYEDIWNKDGTIYKPEKDSKYLRLQRKPINELTYNEVVYLATIYHCWYMAKAVQYNTFEEAKNLVIEYHEDDLEKCYKWLSSLKFPLKIYRALNTEEIRNKSFTSWGSRSWTTNLNIYKKGKFSHCDYIVEATLEDSSLIDNSLTINNFIFYTANKNDGEYEISLKTRFKKGLKLIDLDRVTKQGNRFNQLELSL